MLLSLPSDLKRYLVNFLCIEGILSLRLTCKECYEFIAKMGIKVKKGTLFIKSKEIPKKYCGSWEVRVGRQTVSFIRESIIKEYLFMDKMQTLIKGDSVMILLKNNETVFFHEEEKDLKRYNLKLLPRIKANFEKLNGKIIIYHVMIKSIIFYELTSPDNIIILAHNDDCFIGIGHKGTFWTNSIFATYKPIIGTEIKVFDCGVEVLGKTKTKVLLKINDVDYFSFNESNYELKFILSTDAPVIFRCNFLITNGRCIDSETGEEMFREKHICELWPSHSRCYHYH